MSCLVLQRIQQEEKISKSSQGENDEFNFRHDEFAKPVGHPSGEVKQRFQNLVLNAQRRGQNWRYGFVSHM